MLIGAYNPMAFPIHVFRQSSMLGTPMRASHSTSRGSIAGGPAGKREDGSFASKLGYPFTPLLGTRPTNVEEDVDVEIESLAT